MKKNQKIPKITKIKNRGPLSVSQWDGRSIMCIHDIPFHVSVSNYQSTTMQYRNENAFLLSARSCKSFFQRPPCLHSQTPFYGYSSYIIGMDR